MNTVSRNFLIIHSFVPKLLSSDYIHTTNECKLSKIYIMGG